MFRDKEKGKISHGTSQFTMAPKRDGKDNLTKKTRKI